MRSIVDIAETQSEAVGEFSGDLDALSWDLDEALRAHRLDPSDETLAAVQAVSKRAAAALRALEHIRLLLPPRIEAVILPFRAPLSDEALERLSK